MKRVKYFLLAAIVIALVAPSAAQAATPKLKTKFVVTGATRFGGGLWGRVVYWSLDTTSVTAPAIRGRLLVYKPAIKKWVGYPGRPVKVRRGSATWGYHTVFDGNTDSHGYFKFALTHQQDYTMRYSGSRHTRASSFTVTRWDEVQSQQLSTLTTESVDATHTRISDSADYRFNPYVTHGNMTMVIKLRTVIAFDEEVVTPICTYECRDDVRETPGVSHAECAFIVPDARLQGTGQLSDLVYLRYEGGPDIHIAAVDH